MDVELDAQPYPNGRFARLYDPEGNAIALWEPRPWSARSSKQDALKNPALAVAFGVLAHGVAGLLLPSVLARQLVSGRALGRWWYPKIIRQDSPRADWLVVAVQGAILIGFLLTEKAWHMR